MLINLALQYAHNQKQSIRAKGSTAISTAEVVTSGTDKFFFDLFLFFGFKADLSILSVGFVSSADFVDEGIVSDAFETDFSGL